MSEQFQNQARDVILIRLFHCIFKFKIVNSDLLYYSLLKSKLFWFFKRSMS